MLSLPSSGLLRVMGSRRNRQNSTKALSQQKQACAPRCYKPDDPAGRRWKVMDTAPFETIPAWRIARLRTALSDAEQRGADPNDEGHDLLHRALQRRFALGRGGAKHVPSQTSRPKTTRKGRSFPHLKLVIIWRAILSCRSSAWRQGDTAPFGSIRKAHDQAVAGCRAAGLAPPRYRTVYVLWHRGVPPADAVAAFRGE